MDIQGVRPIVIVYRPVYTVPGGWFAWVAKDNDDHLPAWKRRLVWWPITETQALEWYDDVRQTVLDWPRVINTVQYRSRRAARVFDGVIDFKPYHSFPPPENWEDYP